MASDSLGFFSLENRVLSVLPMGLDRHLGRRGTLLGQKILVVDDEPNIVQSLAFVFNREGFDVGTAGDGVQAMSMIRDSKPNLLILDIVMPNKNGYDVCQEIKSDPELQDIQVVMLSSISNEDSRRHAM